MRLALVFDKLRDDTVGMYFEQTCKAFGITYDHFWTSRAETIPSGYDLYLRIDHGDYQHDLSARVHPKIFFVSDTHLPKPWRQIRRLARRYDLVCCAQRHAAQRLPNAMWVPHACDVKCHGMRRVAKQWDVAFVGTSGAVPRKFYLQALRERYPRSFIGHAPHTELGMIYSQAKIGFNYSIRNDVNMRMFEILCSGSLLVTNALAHDDVDQLGFRHGEHLVYYRRPQELFGLIDYYLEHDEERNDIARRGMEQAQRHHTYRHRLMTILDHAHRRLGLPVAPMLRSLTRVTHE